MSCAPLPPFKKKIESLMVSPNLKVVPRSLGQAVMDSYFGQGYRIGFRGWDRGRGMQDEDRVRKSRVRDKYNNRDIGDWVCTAVMSNDVMLFITSIEILLARSCFWAEFKIKV